jgi:hypothetical protein
MKRREFLKVSGAGVAGMIGNTGLICLGASGQRPLQIDTGPQLFLDDYLIARLDGLRRRIEPPVRLPRPVLDSKTFGTTQPYLTIVRDDARKCYRIWYNHGPAIWHAESSDGIRWARPRVAWDLRRSYGASLVDDGARAADAQRRYKLANWQATRGREDRKGDDGGLYVGFSPDGFRWTAHDRNPVLPTWPEGYPKISRHGVGDIVDVYYDPLRRRYGAAVKLHAVREDGYAPAPRAGQIFRRLVGYSTSTDFMHWDRPWRIFTPDKADDGLLEFYGMGGMHRRGGLTIGLVRVLRDDLPCDPGGPRNGIGYAVLATTRDGVHWQRFREPFLDRNLQAGSWDHAMTWIGGTLPVGDEVYFYYGGYARGHKIAASTERQIGLARMKKDRYAGLAPEKDEGTLRTRPFVVRGDRLTVNVQAPRGELRVRLLDGDGRPSTALGNSEAQPVSGDALAAEIRWPRSVGELRGKAMCLEFRLRHARLFAFELHGQDR